MTVLRSASRRVAAIAVASVVAVGVTVAVAPPASAVPGPIVSRSSTGVTADTLPTAQIDGVVWKQIVHGNTVYAGGSFTTARPAGAAPGVDTVPRNNLMAYDITTGAIVSSFAPQLNGQVKALALSPDGSRLYVGGDFTTVNNQNRYRIAAFDTATGALLSAFAPGTNTTVNAIATRGDAVYIGGAFSQVNGTYRLRLAAFRASDGALTAWAPTAEYGDVQAFVVTPGGGKLVVGGAFTSMNNGTANTYGMGALDPHTGAVVPWAASSTIKNAGVNAAILSLATDGKAVYGTGYLYGSGGNLEGVFSADPSGAINWIEDCHGDTYGVFPVNGVAYSVGHAHDCTRVGGFPTTDPPTFKYALAWTEQATGTLLTNKVKDYADFGGQPSPGLINWFPELSEGFYTKQYQAAWSVAGNSKYVVLGGEFPTANGVPQQGLVRLAVPGTAPSKSGPAVSGYFYKTTSQTALSPTSARIVWPTNWDRDDQVLKYQLVRDGNEASPVYTTTATSQFWNRVNLAYNDTGLQPGTTYQYYVRVTDPDGNTVRGDATTVTTPVGSATGTYGRQVTTDGAANYWRLGDATSSGTAADSVGSAPLALSAGVTGGAPGAINGDADTAASFAGNSTASASTQNPVVAPQTFSIEAWFKTTTRAGGKIVGFGNAKTGSSGSQDRNLYLDNSGRLLFGTYNGKVQSLVSTSTYNDGAWHHVVASLSSAGMALYVDGQLIANDSTFTKAQDFSGYWRVGGDNLGNWPSRPTSGYLNGAIDEVAIYPTALSAAVVADHYRDSGR